MKVLKSPFVRAVIAFLGSLIMLFLLFRRIDVREVIALVRASDIMLVIIASAISISANIFLGTLKWQRILKEMGYPLTFGEAMAIRSGCLPLKTVFPLKSSELVKAYYLKKKKEIPFMRAAGSILFDKALNLFVTFGIFLVGLSLIETGFPEVLAVSGLFLIAILIFLPGSTEFIMIFARKINLKLRNAAEALFSGFKEITLKRKAEFLSYSIVYQLSEFVNTYILFRAVGVDVPFSIILVMIPLVIVVNALPITVMGIGTREGLIVFLFARYGSRASLLGASLLVSFVEHVLPVLFGLAFVSRFFAFFTTWGEMELEEGPGK